MEIEGQDVPLTNQDKVFFPASVTTKGDLVRYYTDLAPAVLNHVARRPMQLKRYPNGVEGDFFYQKRVPVPHPDWLETTHIQFPSGRTADFPVVTSAAGLAWIANLGCIELHTWHSRGPDVERPDYILIDLDPRDGDSWEMVREIALAVRDIMTELGLAAYPKTSGSTGIHILAPILPELEFPEVRRFALALAKEVVKRLPLIASTTWAVARRSGVYVDYGQMSRHKTIASAYSVRPTVDARVSAPLRWDEVADVDPRQFTIQTMRAQLQEVGDLTAGMWERAVTLRGRYSALGFKEPGEWKPPSRSA